MNFINVIFSSDEVLTLKKHNLVIKSNERNYGYDYHDETQIFDWGTPTNFVCRNYNWTGTSWKNLLLDFALWYSYNFSFTKDNLLGIKSSFSNQEIFSEVQKTNYYGPINHNLYINGNRTGNHIWRTIKDLLSCLTYEYHDNSSVLVHYPSAVEPREVIKLIWKKESSMFAQYLYNIGYSKEKISIYIENVKALNSIYKGLTRNYYFFLIDRKPDLLNAISRIKKTKLFLEHKNDFSLTIDNVSSFKNEIIYKDCDYRL